MSYQDRLKTAPWSGLSKAIAWVPAVYVLGCVILSAVAAEDGGMFWVILFFLLAVPGFVGGLIWGLVFWASRHGDLSAHEAKTAPVALNDPRKPIQRVCECGAVNTLPATAEKGTVLGCYRCGTKIVSYS